MRRAVVVAFEGDGRYADLRCGGQLHFELIKAWITLGQSETPSITVDHDIDVIRVIERRRATQKRCLIEFPLRRRELPDQLGKITPVFGITFATALCRKVVLIPPLKLGFW